MLFRSFLSPDAHPSHFSHSYPLLSLCLFLSLSLQASASQLDTAMLISEESPSTLGVILATAATTVEWDMDMTAWSEAEFEERCTYTVKDQLLDNDPEGDKGRTQAERSLPRNLAFKRCPESTEVSMTQTTPYPKDGCSCDLSPEHVCI